MSCIFKIKEASSSFTTTEKRIAEYVMQHRSEAVEASAQTLGEVTETSAAAWIRFAQKLGYKGLTAMKVDLAKDEDENDELFNVLIDQEDSVETMIKKVQQITTNTIQQTYKLLNPRTLKEAIQAILQARNIYLIGIGGSGIICNDMMHKLSRIDRNVIYQEDPHVLLARAAHMKQSDVLVAVSYSGETELVNAAVRYAKKQQTTVIAITQYNVKSTLSRLADIKLYTPIEERELRLGSISSRNSALVLSDLIYYGVAKENFNDTKEKLVTTRELIHEVNS